MKSLDANIVLRLLLQDHEAQSAQIHDMIEAASPNTFAVADAVLFEAVWVMGGQTYQLDRPMIAALLAQLASVNQIKINHALIRRVLPLYLRHPAISFIDVALAVYAELNSAAPLLTYDKKLAKALPELVQTL